MKVVLFCGGQGLRMREASEVVPKPMIPVGNRPILWHVMKYYAHFGYNDFVLCLGYKAEVIKHFFLTYNEALANDFVLSDGGAKVQLLKTDIHNWNITFVDTGLHASIGERLRAVQSPARDDEMFLANYGDTLTDAHLPTMIDRVEGDRRDRSFLAVRPNYSFHVVSVNDDGRVREITTSRVGHLDQRRLLRAAPRVPRRAAARARTSSRSRSSGWSRRPAARPSPRGLLGADGHAQGQAVLESLHESGSRPWELWDPDREARRRARRVPPPAHAAAGYWPATGAAQRLLAIGAHPDDIEIGCGGTILRLIEEGAVAEVCWVVLSGAGERAERRGRAPRRCSRSVPCKLLLRGSATASSRTTARRDQGVLRGAQARLLART